MWSSNALHAIEELVMPRIGLRHLKTHASEVLRDVKDNRARYVITSRNEPIGIIIPYAPLEEAQPEDGEEALAAFFAAADQVKQAWKSPLTPVEVLHEMRR
jgi:prevent-host-death family protein